MASEASSALRSLRDALRGGTLESADDFVFQLSSTLDTLGLAPTSMSAAPDIEAALRRNLPGVQAALVSVVPTFLPALDTRGRALLDSFFVPTPRPEAGASNRAIAMSAYLSLSALLAPKPATPFPAEARDFVLDTIGKLVAAYGVDSLYWACFAGQGGTEGKDAARQLMWEDAVKAAAALPAKVANAVGRWKEAGWVGDVPAGLVPRAYYGALSRRLEGLAYELSQTPGGDASAASLDVLFEKLAAIGLLSPPPNETTAPALLPTFLPSALEHLHPPAGSGLAPYPDNFWPNVLLRLSASTLAQLADAFLAYLAFHIAPPEPDAADESVRRAATVLMQFLGKPVVNGEAWTAVIQALLRRSGSDSTLNVRGRIAVAWVAQGGKQAACALIDTVLEAWSDPKHIKFGLYAAQFHLTHTLLLALSLLPPMDPHLVAVSRRTRFIHAIGSYISHPDPKIRRLGMLVAEVLSSLTIESDDEPRADDDIEDLTAGLEVDEATGEPSRKAPKAPRGPTRLRFTGMWDGSGDGRDEARWLRKCVGVRDDDAMVSGDDRLWMLGWDKAEAESAQPSTRPEPIRAREREHGRKPKTQRDPKPRPKIVMLDDDQAADPLQGYASSAASSRSPSPTPSYLAEVAADPTLALDAAKKNKLRRPVYVRQLAELLRDKDNADAIDLALEHGEALVRAKRGFGGEVTENAVAVAAAAIALSDTFKLDHFEERRQGLLTALVACSPKEVAPYLAEQYFSPSYSLHIKSVMLTALAMGARELAGLAAPAPRTRRIDFPTNTHPPPLHKRYLLPGDSQGQLEDAVDGMRNLLLSKGASQADGVTELARERRLRVGGAKRRKVAEEGTLAAAAMADADADADEPPRHAPVLPYSTVAAEFFILPLVNRFWTHLHDASVRETRAVSAGTRYRGAGTGLILSPMALEKLLLTLALLTHAARHAPTFLAVVVPAILELAVTIGARHPIPPAGLIGDADHPRDSRSANTTDREPESQDAQVVAAALELALAALDAAVDTDKGRTLALDSPQLLLAAGEWAHAVFDAEERGLRSAGAGGAREGRLRAAAAGVVVKVAEAGEKWGAGVR